MIVTELFIPKKWTKKNIKKERNRAYLGSKYGNYEYLDYLLPGLNDNDKVLDCFGGGGNFTSCFQANYPNVEIIYNEKDEDIFNYATNQGNYQDVLDIIEFLENYLGVKKEKWNFKKDKETFTKFKPIYYFIRDNYEELTIAEKNFLIGHSFEKGGRTIKKLGCGNCSIYKNRTLIKDYSNEDFFNINLNDFTFLYLDPPYFNSNTNKGYDNESFEKDFLDKLINKLNNYNGKFMLSYYFEERFIKELNNIKIYKFPHTKTTGGYKTETFEYIYKNY